MAFVVNKTNTRTKSFGLN